jgi:hypothetical protein
MNFYAKSLLSYMKKAGFLRGFFSIFVASSIFIINGQYRYQRCCTT